MDRPTRQYANEIYPDNCSCGINYISQGISYKEHLKKDHIKLI